MPVTPLKSPIKTELKTLEDVYEQMVLDHVTPSTQFLYSHNPYP